MDLALSFFGGLVVSSMLTIIMFGISHLLGDRLVDHFGKIVIFFTVLWILTPFGLAMIWSVSGWGLALLWVGYIAPLALLIFWAGVSVDTEDLNYYD